MNHSRKRSAKSSTPLKVRSLSLLIVFFIYLSPSMVFGQKFFNDGIKVVNDDIFMNHNYGILSTGSFDITLDDNKSAANHGASEKGDVQFYIRKGAKNGTSDLFHIDGWNQVSTFHTDLKLAGTRNLTLKGGSIQMNGNYITNSQNMIFEAPEFSFYDNSGPIISQNVLMKMDKSKIDFYRQVRLHSGLTFNHRWDEAKIESDYQPLKFKASSYEFLDANHAIFFNVNPMKNIRAVSVKGDLILSDGHFQFLGNNTHEIAFQGKFLIRMKNQKRYGFEIQSPLGDPIIYANSDANVGIGTKNPKERLHVDGTVQAHTFLASASSFPDYVFDDTYKLPTLKEIETYVNQYKHLPGMPTEKEVITHGLDIKKVSVKSVEKIEELFLHTIDQQKQVEALDQTLEQQNERIKVLEEKVQQILLQREIR